MKAKTRLFQVCYKVAVFYNGKFDFYDNAIGKVVAKDALDAINKVAKGAVKPSEFKTEGKTIKVTKKDFYPYEVSLVGETNM